MLEGEKARAANASRQEATSRAGDDKTNGGRREDSRQPKEGEPTKATEEETTEATEEEATDATGEEATEATKEEPTGRPTPETREPPEQETRTRPTSPRLAGAQVPPRRRPET